MHGIMHDTWSHQTILCCINLDVFNEMLITSGRVCYKRRKGGWGPGGRARLRTGKKFLLDNHYDGGEDHQGDDEDDHSDGDDNIESNW